MKRRIEKSVVLYDKHGKISAIYDQLEDTSGSKWSNVFDWLSSIVAAFIVIFIVFTFAFRAVAVSGRSMNPTLNDKDWLAVTNFNYKPNHGDIVIVTQPNDLNESIIKRVIGLPGDTIDIDFEKGVVYRNGVQLEENYTNTPTNLSYDISFPIVVPEGKVFVMGDNRNDSLDSRSSRIGFIDERYLLGKVVFRFIPFGQFKIEERGA